MCNGSKIASKAMKDTTSQSPEAVPEPSSSLPTKRRRGKREKTTDYVSTPATTAVGDPNKSLKKKKKKKSKALQKHGKDSSSGGIESLIPSFIGVGILIFGVLAQQGFRGRASVAGIDLGTTNSVICVQAQSKGVGDIDCIRDPDSNSPIIPSVVSFLEPHERKVGPSSKVPSLLTPHPSHVVVGQRAKQRIDSHPHRTLYHAKRVLGRPTSDSAIDDLRKEVEFAVIPDEESSEAAFKVDDHVILPQHVGSYVVTHLIDITKTFLGHDNVKSAVLAVPAKFNTLQRQRTMEAFKEAGVKIARVLEEPAAAALAYGLHKKEGVEKILVYDFGGGTLDVSILHVAEGYCEVIGSDGDDKLGGADFDAAVASYLASRHAHVLDQLASYNNNDTAETLSEVCPRITQDLPICSLSSFHTLAEQLKITLSQTGETVETDCLAVPASSNASLPADLSSLCEALTPEKLSLSLEDYDRVVAPLLDRSILPITRLLEDLTLDETEMDEIVMVGGTTRMPQVRARVRKAFSKAQMNTHIDPDLTVAYGAASVID